MDELWSHTVRTPLVRSCRAAGILVLVIGGIAFFVLRDGIVSPVFAPGGAAASTPWTVLAVAVGIAAFLNLLHRGVTIDRSAGRVVLWSGLWFPLSKDVRDLAVFDRVTLRTEKRIRKRADGRGTTEEESFAVRLGGPDADAVTVRETDDALSARRHAEQSARAAHLPLHDDTGGVASIREPEFLDESLAERLRRTGELPDIPEEPDGGRISRSVEGGTARFVIPPKGRSLEHRIFLFVGAAWFLFMLLMAVFAVIDGEYVAPVFILVVGAPGWLLAVHSLRTMTSRQHVLVDPERLRLEYHGPLSARPEEIPAEELEELHLADDRIVARSDRATIEFARHLSSREREWLHAVIHLALASGPTGGASDAPDEDAAGTLGT